MAGKKTTKKQTEKLEEAQPPQPVVEVNLAAESAEEEPKAVKKTGAKSSPTQKISKRFTDLQKQVDNTKVYAIDEAVSLVKKTSTTKFTGSIEAHFNANQKGLRGFVSLPYSTGQKKIILVFGDIKPVNDVLVGDDKIIEEIAAGKFVPGKHFDLVVATPQQMPKLTRIAKVLGPRGLMPNPKSGTVTDNPQKLINSLQGGQIEYKTEANAPIVHTVIGKANIDSDKLADNLKAVIAAIGPNKISSLTINATMGPAIKVIIS